jgi:dephospho-CoA kinase
VGLIGGIGSGKSWVAQELKRRGAWVIPADEVGHQALRQPSIRDRVVGRWGPEVLDDSGEVDRRQLGARVFADAGERRALEEIVFPWMEDRFRQEIQVGQAATDCRLVVLDAAILLEAGWGAACDCIVFVDAPREVRLVRLAAQRGWTAAELDARERAQMSLEEKIRRADFVIDNSGAGEPLDRQVDFLLGRLGVIKDPTGE